MDKITYNKLIRDRIPEIMTARGKKFETVIMDAVAFERSLLAKLDEEAREVIAAQTRDELIKELADVAEVIQAICKFKGISSDEVELLRKWRQEERGGFEKRLMLVWGER